MILWIKKTRNYKNKTQIDPSKKLTLMYKKNEDVEMHQNAEKTLLKISKSIEHNIWIIRIVKKLRF